MKKIYLMMGFWAALVSASAQNVATFESVQLDSASWWNGSDGTGGFSSGGFWFPNDYNQEWGSWSGFSVSNMKDTITPGYENQFSAITGGGATDSENYAVAYFTGNLKIDFDSAMEIAGFDVTNSTYAYLAMRDGGVNGFAKKFGGADGTDPDYLKLLVWGTNESGNYTDKIDFFLADYRFENPDEDYLVNSWEWLSLKSLGKITALHFSMESSDMGDWGINTPAYFCIDNFTVAEITSSGSLVDIKNDELNVFPNPVKNHLQIELPEFSQTITLSDFSGKVLFKKAVRNKDKIRISGFENYSPGIYLLKVKCAGGYFVQKIVKN